MMQHSTPLPSTSRVPTVKCLVIGPRSGKTSIIHRLISNVFLSSTVPTKSTSDYFCRVSSSLLHCIDTPDFIKSNGITYLQNAFQELSEQHHEYDSLLTHSQFQTADPESDVATSESALLIPKPQIPPPEPVCIIIVADVCDNHSFGTIKDIISIIHKFQGSTTSEEDQQFSIAPEIFKKHPVPILVALNRCDLPVSSHKVSAPEMEKLAQVEHINYIYVSAKDNHNINKLFESAVFEATHHDVKLKKKKKAKQSGSRCWNPFDLCSLL